MSRKKDLNPQLKIMGVLAEHKDFEQSKLKGETKISYPTIISSLSILEKRKLVKCIRTEPSSKGGKEKKIYAITFKGLWMTLIEMDLEKSREQLKHIINLFPETLLFFKKWPLFVKAGIQDEMLDFFIAALRDSWLPYYNRLGQYSILKMPRQHYEGFIQALDSDVANNLDVTTLAGALYVPNVKEILKPIYLQDQELTFFVRDVLARAERQLRQTEEIKSFMFGDKV